MSAKVVISGVTGRMGQTLRGLIAATSDLELIAGIDRETLEGDAAQKYGCTSIETANGAGTSIRDAEIVIDFSAADGTAALLEHQGANLAGKALVVGTTGLPPETLAALEQLGRTAAVIASANYSIGVNLMLGVVAAAAKALPPDRFDVEILESHHRHKADAPSGTALLLGRVVAGARGQTLADVRQDGRTGKSGERPLGEIGFHALRGGEVVGEHRVLFLGAHERFEIAHSAADRGVFAEGALLAARWLIGRKAGWYSMKDVLGLSE